ncbi:MAG: zinc ribbon domain-containing protein [Treponema sp.]|nr:zinc ribbon domain-containing protein [Treponema sp.]
MPKCKICGARLAEGTAICPTCGANVAGNPRGGISGGTASSRASSGMPATPATSTTVTRSTCPHCGAEIIGEHRFCDKCGRNLKEAPEKKQSAPVVQEQSAPAYVNTVQTNSDFSSVPETKQEESKSSSASNDIDVLMVNGNDAKTIKDYRTAFCYFKLAAEQGNADANYEVGDMYRLGRGVMKNEYIGKTYYRQAEKAYYARAAQGDTNALHNLGEMYFLGFGVEIDKQKANSYFLQEAQIHYAHALQGDAKALVQLGFMYKYGAGVEKDELKANTYFQQSLQAWYESASKGDADAMLQLGYTYLNGSDGVGADIQKASTYFQQAIKAYERAAEQGDTHAQNVLGDSYLVGGGVEKDIQKAFYYYSRTAKDDAFAFYKLGNMYLDGIGVEKDEQKAEEYYTRAADQGNTTILKILGDVQQDKGADYYYHSDDKEKSRSCYLKAMRYYERAANLGDADAEYRIGLMYNNGNGVKSDSQKALEYFTRAAEKGHPQAQEAVKKQMEWIHAKNGGVFSTLKYLVKDAGETIKFLKEN